MPRTHVVIEGRLRWVDLGEKIAWLEIAQDAGTMGAWARLPCRAADAPGVGALGRRVRCLVSLGVGREGVSLWCERCEVIDEGVGVRVDDAALRERAF